MELDRRDPEFQRRWAKIVALSWVDPGFRARLIAQPAAVLREYGVDVADGAALAQAAGVGTPPGQGAEAASTAQLATAATVVTTHASFLTLPTYGGTYGTHGTHGTHQTYGTHGTYPPHTLPPHTFPPSTYPQQAASTAPASQAALSTPIGQATPGLCWHTCNVGSTSTDAVVCNCAASVQNASPVHQCVGTRCFPTCNQCAACPGRPCIDASQHGYTCNPPGHSDATVSPCHASRPCNPVACERMSYGCGNQAATWSCNAQSTPLGVAAGSFGHCGSFCSSN